MLPTHLGGRVGFYMPDAAFQSQRNETYRQHLPVYFTCKKYVSMFYTPGEAAGQVSEELQLEGHGLSLTSKSAVFVLWSHT